MIHRALHGRRPPGEVCSSGRGGFGASQCPSCGVPVVQLGVAAPRRGAFPPASVCVQRKLKPAPLNCPTCNEGRTREGPCKARLGPRFTHSVSSKSKQMALILFCASGVRAECLTWQPITACSRPSAVLGSSSSADAWPCKCTSSALLSSAIVRACLSPSQRFQR